MTDYSERDTENLINYSKEEPEFADSNLELENREETGTDINLDDYEEELRNTLSLSGRETEGQSLILSKCKELIEKLREELLQEKDQNTKLREKVLYMADELKQKSGTKSLESQLMEMDEISKTIVQMNEKVELFQREAEESMQLKSVLEEKLKMSTTMNEKLKELLEEKDKIIHKLKDEIDAVISLKEQIPSILELNKELNLKLEQSEHQVQLLMKRNKESDEIEVEIKKLQNSLEESKKAIFQLGANNKELQEKNDQLKQENEQLEDENKKMDELKMEQEIEMEKLFNHQEKLKEMLDEVGNDLKIALDENQNLKRRYEEETRVSTNRRLEEARKKDKEIQMLNKKLANLKGKDENNRIIIEQINEESKRMKDDYEKKLIEERMVNSQRQIMAERLEKELHKNAQDINEMSNQFGV